VQITGYTFIELLNPFHAKEALDDKLSILKQR
jgi:hypothetical protein